MAQMEVSDIIGYLRNAGQITIIVGAGASKSAGIPLAGELVEHINSKFEHCLKHLDDDERKDYGKVMGALSPQDRKAVIQPLLEKAKINWGQIALACLLASKDINIERILTFNFDQVLERACALMGLHLPVYDFGVSPTNDISYLATPAIFHLHGQSYGLRMMNSGDETEKHKNKLKPLLSDSLRNHVVLVLGYSGEADPAFETMSEEFNSNNHLIWCGHSEKPKSHLNAVLDKNYANYIGGCDFDKIMIEIAQGLDCFPPEIFNNPPKHLLDELKDVADWPLPDDESVNILTSTRLALQKAEQNWTPDEAGRAQLAALKGQSQTIDFLKAWDFLSKADTIADEAEALIGEAQKEAYERAYDAYAKAIETKPDMHEAFNNWGASLAEEAKTLSGNQQTEALRKACIKYAKSTDIKPDSDAAYMNWGIALADEAMILSGKKQNDAFKQAYAKYAKALEINPNKYEALNNWGLSLANEAMTLSGKKQNDTFQKAYGKFAKSIEIKSDYHNAFINWNAALINHAKNLSGKQQEETIQLAYEKISNAIEIEPNSHEAFDNWGVVFLEKAKILSGEKQKEAYAKAFEKLNRAKEINQKPNFNLACLYALTNRYNEAIDELEACSEAGTLPVRPLDHIEGDTDLDSLREYPRFMALMKKLN